MCDVTAGQFEGRFFWVVSYNLKTLSTRLFFLFLGDAFLSLATHGTFRGFFGVYHTTAISRRSQSADPSTFNLGFYNHFRHKLGDWFGA